MGYQSSRAETQHVSELPLHPPHPDEGDEANTKYDSIMSTLEIMNSKLSKLDTLENISKALQEEVSQGNSRIEEVSNRIGSVNTELSKYVKQWEEVSASLAGRISKLEKEAESWENRWELYRTSMEKGLKVIQSGVDGNSKKVLEFEGFLKQSTDKWKSLYKLEHTIRKAADKKFQELKETIKSELKTEILEEMAMATPHPPILHEDRQGFKTDIKKEIIEELQANKPNTVTPADLDALRKEIEQSTKPSKITPDDLQQISEEVLAQVQLQAQPYDKKSRDKMYPRSPSTLEVNSHSKLKNQAFARRFNIIIFGLTDRNSEEQDLKEVQSFLQDKMGLTGLSINTTYRLGSFTIDLPHPRPLVVKFANIKDRWTVWNHKRRIPYDRESPIRIQEDIPRKLREEGRVLQRIARVANMNAQSPGRVWVKDYKLNFKGEWLGINDIDRLPPELHPRIVYSPRSEQSLVFFTKNSPLSNHHPSPFSINGMSFSCVEQYLALAKASLAKNESLAKRAMDAQEPATHKSILNLLRNDVQEKWAEQAPSVILPALRAKFQQNEHLAKFLRETYPLPLGEASNDPIWGIGMPLEHIDVLNTEKWEPHGNLLGNTLAQVRDELMNPALHSTNPQLSDSIITK